MVKSDIADVLKGWKIGNYEGTRYSFLDCVLWKDFYKKIEITGVIKFKISISTKIQEILPENLKN